MSDITPDVGYDYFDLLPNEILTIEIFSNFTAEDLLVVSAVCKRFNVCSNGDLLWKHACIHSGVKLDDVVTIANPPTLCAHKEIYLREKYRFRVCCGAYHSILYKKSSRGLFVAGYNYCGELGLGDNLNRFQFEKLSFPSPIIDCRTSDSFVILTDDNSIHCCGYNRYGQLGLNHKNNLNKITKIPSFCTNRIIQISGSNTHSACITESGECYVWGSNRFGASGMGGDIEELLKPTLLTFKENFSSVKCGNFFTLAITQDQKKVYGWGGNYEGQLAIGNFENQFEPILSLFSSILDKEPSDTSISSISCGDEFSVVITSNGKCWSCGGYYRGILGIGNDDGAKVCIPQQILIPSSDHVIKVCSGWRHCIALTKDCKSYVWGDNSDHELGINTNEPDFISTPQELSLPNDIPFIDISAGSYHSLAVNLKNEIFVWGSNNYGQLGQEKELEYLEEPTLIHLIDEANENANQTSSLGSLKEEEVVDENERKSKLRKLND